MKARRFASVVLWASSLMLLAVTVLMFIIRLETEISNLGVYVKFYPMDSEKRFYSWDSISSANVRYYDPTGEYHGWGIKGTSDNRALNIAGDIGLQLVLNNNKRLLIGTQKPAEVMIALSRTRQ